MAARCRFNALLPLVVGSKPTDLKTKNIIMTDEQILKMDFYDLCGSAAVFMTDQNKIDWWRETESR